MKNKKILFISLGCDKNLVDSEVMLGILADRGFEMTDTEDDADIIIINTCCFINDAKEESINTILEMAEYKKTGPCKALIVTGCLAQRYKQEIVDEIPEVDAVIGTSKYDEIFDAVDQALKGSHFLDVDDLDRLPSVPGKRILTTGGHYAHLKIAEGCDKHCTYCIIPKIRGNYRSVPMEQLLAEAASLAEQGVKELILVAQETTLYGVDLYGKKSLHILLQELAKIKGIRWIRILYCYPEEIYPELIETIKNEKKVCHYLDLPIQHASDAVLKRMGRRTSKAQLVEIIEKLRKEVKRALKTDKMRFRHTIGVADTAACLASRYGIDMQKAYISGLLHDCAKCVPDEKKIAECRQNDITITDSEYKSPYLLHSKLGAFYARTQYGINDTDILEAITWHTTGHPDMTMLEKIVFVADYIEPYRNKAANLDKIRYLAFTNIDDAILHILNDTINYLKENDKPIDGITLETYNFYKNYNKSNITIERNNKYHDKRYFKADGKNYRRSIKRKKRL